MSRRSNPVVRRQEDGTYLLALDPGNREALFSLLGELGELLELAPDDPSLQRLHPTAYPDDAERDLEYQLLAGDELRTKRRATIEAVRESLQKEELSEEELWSWLQALNALRLVVGTRLELDDDVHEPPDLSADHPDAPLWDVYGFTTEVLYFVIEALDS